jgi:Trk-type K+ transport system membrane component
LIVLVVAVLPFLGAGSSVMMQNELPGPIKNERLRPQITQTAKLLWLIYAGFTVLCALAYWLAGMSRLDAVIHAFTTLGLGGFSSHDASYGYFNSPLIEGIAVMFMVFAVQSSDLFRALRFLALLGATHVHPVLALQLLETLRNDSPHCICRRQQR